MKNKIKESGFATGLANRVGNVTSGGIAANYARQKLSQYANPKINPSAFINVKSAMNELLRNRIVNNLLGSGRVREERIEKLRQLLQKKIADNPNFNPNSFIKDFIKKLIRKEKEDIIIPTKKKQVLIEPPDDIGGDEDDDSVEEDFSIDSISVSSDGTDVPNGPYRQIGRDYNDTYRVLESISSAYQRLLEEENEKKNNIADINTNDIKNIDNNEETPQQDIKDPNINDQMVGGVDPLTNLPQENPNIKTQDELGRIFELKKIYNRLLSIESYLSFTSDDELLNIGIYVSKSIEFFEIMSSNIDSFRDQIDNIIVLYYKFLKLVYDEIEEYYKKKNKEESK